MPRALQWDFGAASSQAKKGLLMIGLLSRIPMEPTGVEARPIEFRLIQGELVAPDAYQLSDLGGDRRG